MLALESLRAIAGTCNTVRSMSHLSFFEVPQQQGGTAMVVGQPIAGQPVMAQPVMAQPCPA